MASLTSRRSSWPAAMPSSWSRQSAAVCGSSCPRGSITPPGWELSRDFQIHGDFEITVAYTILKADTPIRGYGLSVGVWAETGTPNNDAVTVERGIIPKEGERYTSTRVSGEGPPEVRKYDVRRSPAQSRSGKIRLERAGSMVTASYAEGKEPFRVIRRVELGPEDLTMVRVGAETGVSDHSIEIRLEDLTIRAEGLPGLEGPPPAPAAFPWGLAAGGSAGLALLGAAVWWLAARKRSGKTPRRRSGNPSNDRGGTRMTRIKRALSDHWELLAICAIAVALRLPYLEGRSLWFDEASSWRTASFPPAEMMDSLRMNVHLPLYYLLLKGWMGVFGDSVAACAGFRLRAAR